MIRPAHSAAFDSPVPAPRAPGVLTRLRRHFARQDAALAGQASRSALQPETLRDSGLSPEDLSGAPSHDPALPFFMQAHFGRRHL